MAENRNIEEGQPYLERAAKNRSKKCFIYSVFYVPLLSVSSLVSRSLFLSHCCSACLYPSNPERSFTLWGLTYDMSLFPNGEACGVDGKSPLIHSLSLSLPPRLSSVNFGFCLSLSFSFALSCYVFVAKQPGTLVRPVGPHLRHDARLHGEAWLHGARALPEGVALSRHGHDLPRAASVSTTTARKLQEGAQ